MVASERTHQFLSVRERVIVSRIAESSLGVSDRILDTMLRKET